MDIKSYLTNKGISFREINGELITHCIFGNCDKDSRGSEAHLYFNSETGQYDCKKCGAKGNLITLAKHFGDIIEDEDEINLEGLEKKPKRNFDQTIVEKCHADMSSDIREYLHNRDITDEVINTFKIGYGRFYGKNWITIPIKDESGSYAFLKLRRDPKEGDEKMTFPSHIEAQIYDWEMLQNTSEKIVICEGELDRLPCTPKFTSSFYWYNLGA